MNKKIESISFDFWGTLFRSNPEFSKKRTLLLQEFGISKELIIKELNEYKTRYKELESQGIHLYRDNYIEKLFHNRGLINISYYVNYCNELFLKYPPIEIYPGLINDILKLKENHSVFIASNTGNIHGDILSIFIFNPLEIIKQNCLFSDEIGCTKPQCDMFFDVDIHVGDNPLTDGKCTEKHIQYYEVNQNHTLKSFIYENL